VTTGNGDRNKKFQTVFLIDLLIFTGSLKYIKSKQESKLYIYMDQHSTGHNQQPDLLYAKAVALREANGGHTRYSNILNRWWVTNLQ